MVTIRKATESDIPLLLEFIKLIADYEKLSHKVTATEETLRQSIFTGSGIEALLAYSEGVAAGYAIYYYNFSTFTGKRGIYLEDLFVKPDYRGTGLGKALLQQIARHAAALECERMEWAVLDWNTPAWEFYERIGAAPLTDWTLFRMEKHAIKEFAAKE